MHPLSPAYSSRTLRCLIALIAVLSFCGNRPAMGAVEMPKTELGILNKTIDEAEKYHLRKQSRMDTLKGALRRSRGQEHLFRNILSVAEEYSSNNADSAMRYSYIALSLSGNNPERNLLSRITLMSSLSMGGLFPKALEQQDSAVAGLRRITDPSKRHKYKIALLKASRQLYSYMLSYISPGTPAYEEYRHNYLVCDDSLLTALPPTDRFRRFIAGERLVSEAKYDQARKALEYLLHELPDNSNLYGMTAYQLAEVQRHTGDETGYAAYLAKAAASDIKADIKEGLALPTLANWLFEQGQLNDAFHYINFALDEASEANARMRTVAIASTVPIIDGAYRNSMSKSRHQLLWALALLTVLLIVAAVLAVVLYLQFKKSHQTQRKLAATSKIQEAYIGNFIGMCSSYGQRLDNLSQLVIRKISSGQSDELIKIIKSGRYDTSGDEDFNKTFDSTFLDLYPNFVFEVNKLLRPDQQIFVERNQPLPAELRIYAFVRLGVTESTRIAQILHYSVNTVYTYRNKMRNRAIDRNNFDTQVSQISSN